MMEVIWTRLHTLEGKSAMPWRINSRRTEYKHCPQQCLEFLPSYSLPRMHELVESSPMLRPTVCRPVRPGTKHPSVAHDQTTITHTHTLKLRVRVRVMLRPTVSRPVFWHKAPIWGLRSYFYFCQTVVGLLIWGSLFDERTGLVYNCCPRQHRHSRVWIPRDSWPYFTVSDSRFPNLECQVPVLYPPGTDWTSYTPRHWVCLLDYSGTSQ
jgi:hypothetical protein